MLPYLNDSQMKKIVDVIVGKFPHVPPGNHVNVGAFIRFIYGQFEKQGILRSDKDFERMKKEIPFNDWSKERIVLGKKKCTSRHKKYPFDKRVDFILPALSWGFIKKYFWRLEGATSPGELQTVIEEIYKRVVPDDEMFYVHFGKFKE